MRKWQDLCRAVNRLVLMLCVVGGAAVYMTVQSVAQPNEQDELEALTYVGTEACVGCHEELLQQLSKSVHGRVLAAGERRGKGHLCEGCHGPGSGHVEDPIDEQQATALKQVALQANGCGSCHKKRISPLKWRLSEHRRGNVKCLDCHGQPGQPHGEMQRKPATDKCLACHREQRALMALPSHHPVKEKRITCSDCHDPHTRMGREMRREVCVQCHKKQRGPYIFEHGAISGQLTDACLDCHRPHGSPNRNLLKLNGRGLCLQCHADKAVHFVGGRCRRCHQGIHGSNTSRFLFSE